MKRVLEVATNIAVLLVALLLLGNFAWVHLAERRASPLESGLRRGDVFPSLLPRVDFSKSAKTLIIALSSRCEHCNEAIPFFRQLLEADVLTVDTTQIVAVFPETAEEVRQYILDQKLRINAIPGINYQTLRLPGAPSAVLVDNEGRVLNFWVGKPSKEVQMEILDSVRTSKH